MPNEPDRLKALAQYGLSADSPLTSLEPLVKLAVRAFEVPAAAVNMIGQDEVFFAASEGIGDCNKARDVSFCAHVITQDDVLVVEDTKLDVRFHDNPLVTGPEQIRFYAGVPLRSPEGYALGALCLVDARPHASFSSEDRSRLMDLARVVCDRLEIQRLKKACEQGRSRFDRIATTSPNGIISFTTDGAITAVNSAAEAIYGHRRESLVGRPLEVLMPAWRSSQIAELMARSAREDSSFHIREDFIGLRADGSKFPLEIAWSSWTEGDDPNFGLVVRDITAQRRQEDQLYRLAHFDSITGLPNAALLRQRLAEVLEYGRAAALLVIGINKFQELADTAGGTVADEVLERVGKRLAGCVRSTDTVARSAADQFTILLSGIGDPLRAREVSEAALAGIARPMSVNGLEIRLEGSCGIALSPSHAETPEELVASASLALQEAKRQGIGHSLVYVPALRMHAVARRLFDTELHQAVDRQELQLYYQPQVRVSDGQLTGAEALLRWNHPERGLLAPAAFLPALENSSLAVIVGNWVIDAACCQAEQWRASLSDDFRMSVNLFAAQFHSGNLRSFVRSAMERYNLPAGALELEITENTVVDDEARFLPLLEGLKEDGVELAFDDFGTGFASLSLVARYPLTHLKIDKSFVQRAFASEKDRAIVQAITELAHRLQLEVIAEGVENRRYLDFCREIGCDEAQGYLLGKPVPSAEFADKCLAHLRAKSIGRG